MILSNNKRTKGIKTNDWLIKGISKEQLQEEKIQALTEEISRLQAENEGLKYLNDANIASALGLRYELQTAKAEAYKECIEKVKEYYKNKLQNYQFNYDAYCKLCEELNSLYKELVGEENG